MQQTIAKSVAYNTIYCFHHFPRWSELSWVVLLLLMVSAGVGKSKMLFHLLVWRLSWGGCKAGDWPDLSLPGFPQWPAWAFSLQGGLQQSDFLHGGWIPLGKAEAARPLKGLAWGSHMSLLLHSIGQGKSQFHLRVRGWGNRPPCPAPPPMAGAAHAQKEGRDGWGPCGETRHLVTRFCWVLSLD